MNPAERKQFLQGIGALPPDPGDQVNPFAEAGLGPQAQAARNIRSEGEPTSAGAQEPDAAIAEDPREKLRRLATPELLQKLRERAGAGTGGLP